MPNITSAKKRMRQNAKRRLRNRMVRTKARTFVKKANESLASGDAESATEAVRQAMSQLDRAAQKGTLHTRNADRRKARLAKRLATLVRSV
ncbi:MAG: 30S ribosomal protein S20 [Chloroflexi bacterium]|nr:30S ribosomal protein S20 [Chloroflexota bacterium]